jgi:hypothetical protein
VTWWHKRLRRAAQVDMSEKWQVEPDPSSAESTPASPAPADSGLDAPLRVACGVAVKAKACEPRDRPGVAASSAGPAPPQAGPLPLARASAKPTKRASTAALTAPAVKRVKPPDESEQCRACYNIQRGGFAGKGHTYNEVCQLEARRLGRPSSKVEKVPRAAKQARGAAEPGVAATATAKEILESMAGVLAVAVAPVAAPAEESETPLMATQAAQADAWIRKVAVDEALLESADADDATAATGLPLPADVWS